MVRNPIEQAKKAIGNANSAIIWAFTPSSSSPVPTVPILQPNTDIPVVPTTPADISANSKQAQFDQANPVGTAMSDVRYTPQPVASASNVPISSVWTTQAISAPPAIEKTTTTTPEGTTTVKKETPWVITPDWNVGKGREQEIMSNLETWYSKDPNIQKAIASGDYNAFKSAYGYDTSDSVKKGLLDSFFQARQPKTQESFFDSLITGLKIAKDKFVQSPEARSAQYRFDAIATYKGASVETLYNGMTNGILTPWSQAYKDLVAMNGGIETPEMAMAKQKLANKQRVDRVNTEIKAQSDTYKGVESTSAPDATQTISNKVVREKGLTWAQKYAESVSNNPELVELATTIKNDSARKKEIERVRADIYKNIIEKHPGITKWAANLLAKRESEAFDEEYNNIIDTLNVNSADLRYKTSMLEKSFDYDYKQAEDARNFEQQKELAQFQQELGLKSDQAKFEQQMKQKAQIVNDPVLATQDVIDTYAELGILPERSAQEIIQSVQNDIAGGMTLAQSLSNLNKAFQSKDLYKAIIAEKTQQKPISVGKDSYIYDPVTGTFKSPTGAGVGAWSGTSSNWISSIGDGKVTFYGGRVAWDVGMDIAGKEGFEVTSPVNGEVMKGGFDKNYGNYLDIMATDGSRVRLSHLDENVIFQPGTQIVAGQVLGNQKNTGTVIARPGRGVLDITTWWPDGKARSGKDTEKYLTGTSGQATGWEVMGSAGVPLSYQRRIEQMVPVQLRNSDAESKKLLADIRNMSAAGLSPEDATLTYLGFNVTDANRKAEAMSLVSQARGLGEALPEDFFIKLSDYVNNGNMAGAKSFTDRIVEGTIKKQIGEDFVSTPNLKFAESTLNRLESMIERNRDKIWPLSGRFSDVQKKLMNDPDYQALQTLLQWSLADTRRAFGGTAVSQSELEALKNFVWFDTKMPIENLLTGLRTNYETLRDKYGQQRNFYLGEDLTSAPISTTPTTTAVPEDFLSIYNSID